MTAQLPLPLGFAEGMGEADFFAAPCNLHAWRWIGRFPDWGHHATLLLGPEGSGKTHLAAIFKARHEARAEIWDQTVAAADETRLFHRYNAAREAGHGLLIVAREAPAVALPDLASRLAACPVVRIEPPDDEVLGAVLIKTARDRGFAIPPEVLRYALPRLERSFRAVRQFTLQLDALSLAQQRAITVPLAARALAMDGLAAI